MQAGLPTPGGFALTADAYRHQLRHLGIDNLLRQYSEADLPASRRISIQVRLALYECPIAPEILEPLLGAWRKQREGAPLGVVRSSALIEDRKGANFAGQFESFLGLSDETEFLTAVRACWAALWTSHARRYMENHELSPADTAMGVLIQPLIPARVSGGGLSETAERTDDDFGDLGTWLRNRPGRGRARSHRAQQDRFPAHGGSRTQRPSGHLHAWRLCAGTRPKRSCQRTLPLSRRGGDPRPSAA